MPLMICYKDTERSCESDSIEYRNMAFLIYSLFLATLSFWLPLPWVDSFEKNILLFFDNLNVNS